MKTEVEARSTLIQTTYDLVEKVNALLQNYTIDYEEYFNRQMVGCNLNQSSPFADINNYSIAHGFTWNVTGMVAAPFAGNQWNGVGGSGNCAMWTAYGNETAMVSPASTYVSSHTQHKVYACFLSATADQEWWWAWSDRMSIWFAYTSPATSCAVRLFNTVPNNYLTTSVDFAAGVPFRQAYGQYAANFIDVRDDVDDKPGRAWDDDDTNIGKGPVAIQDNQRVQELYLISKDKKKRLMLRRKLLEKQDFDGNAIYSWFETRYAIQMLQLKAFDAGENHDFDATQYTGVYDGIVDTWACDADAGYVCNGPSLNGIYAAYNLPSNGDDGWVNITSDEISASSWNFVITPTKDPSASRWEQEYQLNPFITMSLQTVMYGKKRYQKIGKQIQRVTFEIQTAFNVKTYY